MLLLCYILLSAGLNSCQAQLKIYHQTDYGVKLERAQVMNYDRQYFDKLRLALDWYNRTQRVINASSYFVEDFKQDIKIDVQAYKFLSNEYRYFPITFTTSVCDIVNKNLFGLGDAVKKYSNMRICPAKAGFYYLRNAALDFSYFPPSIPGGQYKVTAKGYYISKLVFELDFYATVTTFITK